MGVAWWLPPTKVAAQFVAHENWRGVLCLSRLVIAPGVPRNACTFLLARSRAGIPATDWHWFVTYADQFRGHTGAIYRGDNWEPKGMTKRQAIFELNGKMVSRKKGPRTLRVAEMNALGAVLVGYSRKFRFVKRNA